MCYRNKGKPVLESVDGTVTGNVGERYSLASAAK